MRSKTEDGQPHTGKIPVKGQNRNPLQPFPDQETSQKIRQGEFLIFVKLSKKGCRFLIVAFKWSHHLEGRQSLKKNDGRRIAVVIQKKSRGLRDDGPGGDELHRVPLQKTMFFQGPRMRPVFFGKKGNQKTRIAKKGWRRNRTVRLSSHKDTLCNAVPDQAGDGHSAREDGTRLDR